MRHAKYLLTLKFWDIHQKIKIWMKTVAIEKYDDEEKAQNIGIFYILDGILDKKLEWEGS